MIVLSDSERLLRTPLSLSRCCQSEAVSGWTWSLPSSCPQAGNIVDKVHKMDVFNRAEREVTRSLITISLAVTATVLGRIFARKYLWSDSVVLITYKSRLEVIVQLTLVSDNTQLPSCRVLRIH